MRLSSSRPTGIRNRLRRQTPGGSPVLGEPLPGHPRPWVLLAVSGVANPFVPWPHPAARRRGCPGGRRVGRRLGTSRGVSESPLPPVCAPPRLKPPGTQRSAEGCGMPPGRDPRQLLGASGGGAGDFSEPTSPRTPQSRGLRPTTSAQREMPASKALPHAHETEGLNVLRR